jgi:hypothetical protein
MLKLLMKIGGIYREIVYDNMKQAVKKFVGQKRKRSYGRFNKNIIVLWI